MLWFVSLQARLIQWVEDDAVNEDDIVDESDIVEKDDAFGDGDVVEEGDANVDVEVDGIIAA